MREIGLLTLLSTRRKESKSPLSPKHVIWILTILLVVWVVLTIIMFSVILPEKSKGNGAEIKTAAVGTLLKKPEVELNLLKAGIFYSQKESGKWHKGEIGCKLYAERALYFLDAEIIKEPLVFSIPSSLDKYTKYTKGDSNFFVKQKINKKNRYETDNEFLYTCQLLADLNFSEYRKIKYLKCEDEISDKFGNVLVYDTISLGEKTGTIWVDKKTGICVRRKNDKGEDIFIVNKIETENYFLPNILSK